MMGILRAFVAGMGFIFGFALFVCLFIFKPPVNPFDAVLMYSLLGLSSIYCFSIGFTAKGMKK